MGMAVVMFVATAGLIATIVWITGQRGDTPPTGTMSIKVVDLPEGEMHLVELAILSMLVSLVCTILAMALSTL